MEKVVRELTKLLEGEVSTHPATRYSVRHDASMYELTPDVVIAPQHSADVEALVSYVAKNKPAYPKLAITPRGAGTDMSGGAIGSSIVLDMTAHFTAIEPPKGSILHAQPGALLRTIDPLLAAKGQQLGCAPTSRGLCTLGGVIANNAAGEQSLRFGSAHQSVRELTAVLADGKSYTFAPITKRQLDRKMAQTGAEADLYRKVYNLIERHYDTIRNARPRAPRNSMGYGLWNVWDRDTGIFDMTQLFTGSQGTLGIITDVKIATVPKAAHSGLLLVYLSSHSKLGDVISTIMRHNPATFEGFDDITFSLGLRQFKTLRRQLGTKEYIRQQAHLSKSVARFKGHLPNTIMMVGFEGDTPQAVYNAIEATARDLGRFRLRMDIEDNEAASAPFRNIRRASLALLRHNLHSSHASPFIDDMTIQPRFIPEFLKDLRKVIRKHKLPATIQGHFGDGTFHVVPLVDGTSPKYRTKLEPIMRELIPIVLKYGGTMAGEHNDGMVRGPWLPAVFGQHMYNIFRDVKEIFDPNYIFNPYKKTDASWEYSMSHLRQTPNNTLRR